VPKTKVVYFADKDGRAPLLACFDKWPKKVLDKCVVRIERLQEMGHELRRPEADFLRDGIYELRVKHLNVNYRILYFFHGKTAVLFDGLTKESEVPPKEIEKAISAKNLFAKDTVKHTYGENDDED
jgi:phage-related protein